MKKNIMVVDLDRCIGCKACQVACKMENGVALGASRNQVLAIGPTGVFPDLEMYFLPMMCQQCEEPVCVQVCPTGASYKRSEDGLVLIEKEKCIGCKSCMNACPYEANIFNNELRVTDKCTLCEHLQKIGEEPACVKICAGSALIFGDINDPESKVSKAIKAAGEENVYSLRNFDNDPSTKYILRNAKWVDILPQECAEVKGRRR